MLSLRDVYKVDTMSVDEAMMSSRYKSQYHTRDGTVLPPTMTSRRFGQATMSVVDMSRVMDMSFGLGTPRHRHCYDDQVSAWRPVKRSRRRRRHDDVDDVELMDTLDHTPRYMHHVTSDVSTTDSQRLTRPEPVHNSLDHRRAARRPRLLADIDYNTSQPKWTSSRYFQTHADKQRRRVAAKSRHNVNTRHHQRHQSPPDDVIRRTTSSPVRHVTRRMCCVGQAFIYTMTQRGLCCLLPQLG